jgi:predicted 2-oxoglutarate/Fe(II)-dependent dioxygenase YbiX
VIMKKEELSPGIVIYKDAIKDRTYLLDLMKKVNYDEIGGGRDVGISYINEETLDTNLLDIQEILESSLNECLEDYCSKYMIEGIIPEDWQLVRYGKDQQFVTHLDENYDNPRTVSLTMYINNDYAGGELEYVWFNKLYKPQAGDIIIFPSNYIFSHKVHKVLLGTRYAVVRFYKWKTLKQFTKRAGK